MTNPELFTFGAIESPATDSIDVPLGATFQCPCGHEIAFDDPWLAAHWQEKIKCQCDKCHQKFHIRAGRIKLKGKPYASPKHVFGT